MPQVIVTEGAARGLERCHKFLLAENPHAANRAGQTISRQLGLLETSPEISRPLDDYHELRKLVIGFGDSECVALYRYETNDDTVYVLTFRHQKEAG